MELIVRKADFDDAGPNADREKFATAANNAKAGCPVLRLLNAPITVDAKLES
jgi:lipoyl-dependent peroxiredoxin